MAKAAGSSTVGTLCEAMERIAPTWAAADWDNVGLLAGDRTWPAARVILTIDLTPVVLDEAVRGRMDAVVAYHPPIFQPVGNMTTDRTSHSGLAAEALSRRIAVYSPHTALDAAPGGTNDAIAAMCGLTNVRPFDAVAPASRRCKLVVFVPAQEADRVADAVFDAGAGRIGNYEKCSYRLAGVGTFWGGEGTSPTVGRRGRLERVDEIRLEVVFPRERLADVIAAVRRSHSYEEPAFDVYPLEPAVDPTIGPGRIGRFGKPVTVTAVARVLKLKTGGRNVQFVGDPRQTVRRGLVCVGAAGSLPFDLCGSECGPGAVAITGEMRHHDALRYERLGMGAIALGHWVSERPVLAPLASRLRAAMPGTAFVVSRADRAPFRSV